MVSPKRARISGPIATPLDDDLRGGRRRIKQASRHSSRHDAVPSRKTDSGTFRSTMTVGD